jgi:diaminohydroxyphosphoribosylaminopyrimidine deaminase/5-amino-6-(5-phosphoribosylamino)uracil reductase
MTLDGKIATASGESKWITGEKARAYGMKLREGADAIVVGINTILRDNPRLTVRGEASAFGRQKKLRRIILDSFARTPLNARVVTDRQVGLTTIVVGTRAPARRVAALAKRVNVLIAPATRAKPRSALPAQIDLQWLLKRLGSENVTSLLVEGGGEVNASFLFHGLAHRIAFFYAPKVLGGRHARRAIAGDGARRLDEALDLTDIEWKRLGPDLRLTARVVPPQKRK